MSSELPRSRGLSRSCGLIGGAEVTGPHGSIGLNRLQKVWKLALTLPECAFPEELGIYDLDVEQELTTQGVPCKLFALRSGPPGGNLDIDMQTRGYSACNSATMFTECGHSKKTSINTAALSFVRIDDGRWF